MQGLRRNTLTTLTLTLTLSNLTLHAHITCLLNSGAVHHLPVHRVHGRHELADGSHD